MTSRVAHIRCDSYDEDAVFRAVGRGLELLGGANRFVHAGERIVLKPNLLVANTAEQAVTTHPAVFAAVARQLRAAGAELSWGDSPGFGSAMSVGKRAGIVAEAESLGIPLADFHATRTVSFADGHLIKQFEIAEGVMAADGLVSLPKLKTHALTRMTGAVKNQFGCIPGLRKGEFHARMPDHDRFAAMLVDLNALLRPRLIVMDGVVGMEGNGPRSGDPRHIGSLLMSDDPVAVDSIACRIIALDPGLVETCVWGETLGLGAMTDIEVVGDELPLLPDFIVNREPRTSADEGRFGSPLAKRHLAPRPRIQAERCTRCGTCVKVCPVSPRAVDFADDDTTRPPVYDYEACIRCYCCQEMCPERAIDVRTPLLGRLIRR